jgi:heme-degrading monooxygenase HmoA
MQVVTVGLFTVPRESKAAFMERAHDLRKLNASLPGLVEGFFYEKKSGDSEYNHIAIAVWEDEKAFEGAGKSIYAAFQKQGFNPAEEFARLRVVRIRSKYTRDPY